MKRIFLLAFILTIISCDDIIEVPDISNESVVILAPTNGVILTTTSITFNWNSVVDAESYRIQIATPNFEEAQQIITNSVITDTNFSTTLQAGDYEWRIRAENSAYQTEYSTQSFSVEE